MLYLTLALLLMAPTVSTQANSDFARTRVEPTIQLPSDLARVLTEYETAWRTNDSAKLSRLFARDGFVLSPGSPMVRGRDAIESFYRDQGGPLFLRAVAYAVDGNVGFIIGGFTHQSGTPDTGKFTLTLEKDATGRWLIMSDMDNGNRPAQDPSRN